jgi:PKD repeat protein
MKNIYIIVIVAITFWMLSFRASAQVASFTTDITGGCWPLLKQQTGLSFLAGQQPSSWQ